ncbi:conserved hypothetical protein, partial [Neospora caninum Liverpool]
MDTSDGKLCPLSSEAPGSALEKQSSRAQNQQTDHSAKRTGISGVTEENAKAEGAKEKRKTGRPDPIVQYVVLRKDLQTLLGWPAGAVIAQACHACISIVASTYSDPAVQAYLAEGDSMRKVVLEVHGEEELRKERKYGIGLYSGNEQRTWHIPRLPTRSDLYFDTVSPPQRVVGFLLDSRKLFFRVREELDLLAGMLLRQLPTYICICKYASCFASMQTIVRVHALLQ